MCPEKNDGDFSSVAPRLKVLSMHVGSKLLKWLFSNKGLINNSVELDDGCYCDINYSGKNKDTLLFRHLVIIVEYLLMGLNGS